MALEHFAPIRSSLQRRFEPLRCTFLRCKHFPKIKENHFLWLIENRKNKRGEIISGNSRLLAIIDRENTTATRVKCAEEKRDMKNLSSHDDKTEGKIIVEGTTLNATSFFFSLTLVLNAFG